jgi:hypothetical protein
MVGVGMFVLGGACAFSPDGLELGGEGTAATPPQAPSSMSSMPSGEGEAPPPSSALMRAHHVQVKNLSVGVLFADKVEAKNGTVEASGPPLPAAELEAQAGTQDIEMPELVVEVLYAHDVKAQVLSVRELHVTDVKIGKEHPEN